MVVMLPLEVGFIALFGVKNFSLFTNIEALFNIEIYRKSPQV